MKEYGTDFQSRYNYLQKEQQSLENKIRKRAKFLSSASVPFDNPLENSNIDNMSIPVLIDMICQVESLYTGQFKQGDLFD